MYGKEGVMGSEMAKIVWCVGAFKEVKVVVYLVFTHDN